MFKKIKDILDQDDYLQFRIKLQEADVSTRYAAIFTILLTFFILFFLLPFLLIYFIATTNVAHAATVPITDLTEFQKVQYNLNSGTGSGGTAGASPLIVSTSTMATLLDNGNRTFTSIAWRPSSSIGLVVSTREIALVQNGVELMRYEIDDYCITQADTNNTQGTCWLLPIPFYTEFDPNYALHIYAYESGVGAGIANAIDFSTCGSDALLAYWGSTWNCVNRITFNTVPVYQVTVGTSTSSGGGGTIIVNAMNGTTTCEIAGDTSTCVSNTFDYALLIGLAILVMLLVTYLIIHFSTKKYD